MKHNLFLVVNEDGHYYRCGEDGDEWTDNIGLAWIWRTSVVHDIASLVKGTVIGGAR